MCPSLNGQCDAAKLALQVHVKGVASDGPSYSATGRNPAWKQTQKLMHVDAREYLPHAPQMQQVVLSCMCCCVRVKIEYEPPQVLGATTSGPEALDNLADKGDMQVRCTAA
jgi:hypothetical protein